VPGATRAAAQIRAQRGGTVIYEQDPGEFLRAGTVIARIYGAFGDLREECVIPIDGYVLTYSPLSWIGAQAVAAGDYVADIAVSHDEDL
jgi:predicted deacylase